METFPRTTYIISSVTVDDLLNKNLVTQITVYNF
jgi:hypothetical protein